MQRLPGAIFNNRMFAEMNYLLVRHHPRLNGHTFFRSEYKLAILVKVKGEGSEGKTIAPLLLLALGKYSGRRFAVASLTIPLTSAHETSSTAYTVAAAISRVASPAPRIERLMYWYLVL